ncbi:MAG: ribosome silencing factor [Micrococcales bacterium]
MTASANAIKVATIAAQAAADKLGENIIAIDVSDHFAFPEVSLIISAKNERQVAAIADFIEDELHKAGIKLLGKEGKVEGRWILENFGDVVCHVFHEEDRMTRGLERLYDGPRIELDVS